MAKVIFLHLSVIHSVHRGRGGLPQYMLGYHPLSPRDYLPPQTMYPPDYVPPWTTYPPDYVTPRLHTPQTIYPPDYIPLRLHTPPDYVPPWEADSSIQSTSSRYASYWNAFLFKSVIPSNCFSAKIYDTE